MPENIRINIEDYDMPVITPEDIQRYADAQALASGPQLSPAKLARDLDIARRLQANRPKLEEIEKKLRSFNDVLERVRAQVRRNDAVLAKMERGDELRKERNLQREAGRLRKVLQQAQAMRKSGRLAKLPWGDRRRIEEAEQVARRALAKVEAQAKARRSSKRDRNESRQAMLDRGVTFHTMMVG